MSSILRCRLQGHRQHSFHFNITEPSRRARSRLIQQTIKPFVQKTCAPFANHLLGHPQAFSYRPITFPSAHARMIRARWANAWLVFGRRAHCLSGSRSSSAKLNAGIGRPVRISFSFITDTQSVDDLLKEL
jgi:hypothetical protein